MKKLVHKYLSANFYFEDRKLKSRSTLETVISSSLKREILIIFDIDQKDFKKILRTWWLKHTKTPVFKQFWKTNFFIPFANRGECTLIASGLVSVQPMAMPRGVLFHFDYTNNNTGNHIGSIELDMAPTGRGVTVSAMTSQMNLLWRNQQNFLLVD